MWGKESIWFEGETLSLMNMYLQLLWIKSALDFYLQEFCIIDPVKHTAKWISLLDCLE